MTFWLLYDHAGYLIALNIITLVAVLGPAWALARLAADRPLLSPLVALVAASAALAGQAHLIVALIGNQEFSYRHVVRGIARHGLRAITLSALYLAGFCAAGAGVWFYTVSFLPERPLIGFVLSGVSFSAGLVLAMSAIYLLPALVLQRGSMVRAARTSGLLAGRHPVLSVGLVMLAAAYAAVLATPPGILLFSALPLVALSCSAYELLDRQYGAEALLAREEVPAAGATAGLLDEDDIYLNRGFNDFLFPWKT